MDAITTYTLLTANVEKTRTRLEASPIVSREVEYYQANIGNIESSEEFVNDRRLMNFALKAFGLEEMSYATAFIKKVIDGPEEAGERSFAEQLNDPRYQELADAFDFTTFGAATTSFARASEDVVEKYFQATIEEEAGNQNTGARLAMYFERKAADIESPFEIIADRALYQVIQTAFQLPSQIATTNIDKQADIISDRLDLEDLKDPEQLKKLTDRFLNIWDTQNQGTAASVPPLVGLAGTQSLSLDLISSIQTFRR